MQGVEGLTPDTERLRAATTAVLPVHCSCMTSRGMSPSERAVLSVSAWRAGRRRAGGRKGGREENRCLWRDAAALAYVVQMCDRADRSRRRQTFNHLTSWLTDARNLTNPNTGAYCCGVGVAGVDAAAGYTGFGVW